MDFLRDDLILLTVRCALASEWTFAGCKRRLEAVGFTVTPPTYAAVWMALAALGLSVATVLVWFATIKNPSSLIPGVSAVGVTRSFVISPLNVIASVLLVYHLKRHYAFANEGVFGGLPFKFIWSIGFVTALLMFPVQAIFDYYQFPGDHADTLVHGLPVSVFMWATGSMVALLVQDSMWSSFGSVWAKRVMDGIVFGANWAFAVALLFAINRVFSIPVMASMAKADFHILALILGFCFVAGFVLGFCLMASVRQAASLRFAREEMTSSAAFVHA